MANGSAIPTRLTSLWITAGYNTAFTAPSGTAVVVNYWSLIRSGVVAGNITAAVLYGPTANLVLACPVSAYGKQKMVQGGGAFILGSGGNEAFIISAASSTAFSFYMGGLQYS